MTEYKLYKSPWKGIWLIFVSGMFVYLGVYLLNKPGSSAFMSWACILFFGIGVLAGLFQLFDKRPQLIFNEMGLFDRTMHKQFINWEIIRDAYPASIGEEKFICLLLDEEFKPSRSKAWFGKKMTSLSRSLGFQEFNLSIGSVEVNAERLTRFILAMRSADKAERPNVLAAAMHDF